MAHTVTRSKEDWDRMKGVRVKAVHFATENSSIDDNVTVPPGTLGTIDSIDDAGTIHVDWDNGCRLGLLPDTDRWEEIG